MNLTKAVSIENLVKKYGSPLFIVSGEVLKNNIQEFKKIFSLKYSNVEVAYAYKANYLSEVLNIIHESGAWAEVASGFEYEIAKGNDSESACQPSTNLFLLNNKSP